MVNKKQYKPTSSDKKAAVEKAKSLMLDDVFETVADTDIPIRKRIMEEIIKTPLASINTIARRVNASHQSVQRIMNDSFFKDLKNQIDELFKNRLSRLHLKALQESERLLEDSGVKDGVKLNLIKFLLQSKIDTILINDDDGENEIIFETRITKSGILEKEQRVVKKLKKETDEENL